MSPVLEYFASVEMLVFFGVASGVLSTFAYIPYIIDTISRRTQPQRASWLIWSVLGSIAFFSQIFEGATSSLWFAGVQVGGTIIVFVLSIWIGQGRYLSKSDYLILAAAGVGLVLWYLTENAAYALAITISISLLGGMATVVKAYREPESETLITWVVSFVASICAILSLGVLDYTLLAYPLYLFTLYFSFIVAILLGRRRDARGRVDAGGRVDARGSQRDAYGREPVPALSSRVSIAGFFSGLRKTADAVIVSAALVFAFNWFSADSSAVDTATDALTLHDSPIDQLKPLRGPLSEVAGDQQSGGLQPQIDAEPVRLVDTAGNRSSVQGSTSVNTSIETLVTDYRSGEDHRAGKDSVAGAGEADQGKRHQATLQPARTIHTLAELANMNTPPVRSLFDGIETEVISVVEAQNDVAEIIVVAVDRTQATARPWILHESDPLAIVAKSQVTEWLAAGAQRSEYSREIEPIAQELSQRHTPVYTVPLPIVDTSASETSVTGSSGQFDRASAKGYLQLDEDDPFAVLVAVGDTAVLAHGHNSAIVQSRLVQGERVQAIATNGEWYQVRSSNGEEGFVHHSQVLVEALSSLANQQAG